MSTEYMAAMKPDWDNWKLWESRQSIQQTMMTWTDSMPCSTTIDDFYTLQLCIFNINNSFIITDSMLESVGYPALINSAQHYSFCTFIAVWLFRIHHWNFSVLLEIVDLFAHASYIEELLVGHFGNEYTWSKHQNDAIFDNDPSVSHK